jgi:hypothetical protein
MKDQSFTVIEFSPNEQDTPLLKNTTVVKSSLKNSLGGSSRSVGHQKSIPCHPGRRISRTTQKNTVES